MEREWFFEGIAFSPDGVAALGRFSSKSLTAFYNYDLQLNSKAIFLTGYTQWDTLRWAAAYVDHLIAEDILHDLKLLPQ